MGNSPVGLLSCGFLDGQRSGGRNFKHTGRTDLCRRVSGWHPGGLSMAAISSVFLGGRNLVWSMRVYTGSGEEVQRAKSAGAGKTVLSGGGKESDCFVGYRQPAV